MNYSHHVTFCRHNTPVVYGWGNDVRSAYAQANLYWGENGCRGKPDNIVVTKNTVTVYNGKTLPVAELEARLTA